MVSMAAAYRRVFDCILSSYLLLSTSPAAANHSIHLDPDSYHITGIQHLEMPSLRGIFKIAYEPVYKDATQALFRRHRKEIRSNASHKVDSRERQSLLVAAHLAGEEEVQRAQDENLAELVRAQEHWPAFMRYPEYRDDSDINDGDENLF